MSNPVVRIVGQEHVSCCACAEQSGCSCNGIGCGLECQGKATTATLCGFPEFTDPSAPPNYYLKKAVTGTLTIKRYVGAGCPDPAPGTSPKVTIPISGNPFEVTITGSATIEFSRIDSGTGHPIYKLTSLTPTFVPGHSDATLYVTLNPTGSGSGSSENLTIGSEFDVTLGPVSWTAKVSVNFSGQVGSADFMPSSVPPVQETDDVWNVSQEYASDDPTCATITNSQTSSRTVDGDTVDPGDWPEGLFSIDGPGYAEGTTAGMLGGGDLSQTTRKTAGTDTCFLGSGGYYWHYNGTISEDLSVQDSESAALDRATAAADWVPGDCATTTAFITVRVSGPTFGAQKVRTRANLTGLVSGHSYDLKIRYFRRVLGTSGPFLFFSQDEVTISASASTMNSDWFDVPNEAGWETQAHNCTCELVS